MTRAIVHAGVRKRFVGDETAARVHGHRGPCLYGFYDERYEGNRETMAVTTKIEALW